MDPQPEHESSNPSAARRGGAPAVALARKSLPLLSKTGAEAESLDLLEQPFRPSDIDAVGILGRPSAPWLAVAFFLQAKGFPF
jgi:hypothetical protein